MSVKENITRMSCFELGILYSTKFIILWQAIKQLEKKLTFAYSKRHGYLTFCPTNLGTTLRASVHIKVPKLAKNEEILNKICADNKLQPRGKS